MGETEKGNKIVTERLSDGRLSWIGNTDDLDDRNSLAKLSRSEICSTGATVRDMVNCRAALAQSAALSSKRYVQATFLRGIGSQRGQPLSSSRDVVAAPAAPSPTSNQPSASALRAAAREAQPSAAALRAA